MAAQRRLLVVSNGHGEDSIAAEIIRRLPAGLVADAYPTLGDGSAYRGVCDIVGPRTTLASGGSRAYHGSLWQDIRGGVLFTILPSLKFLREAAGRYDRIVVVGDLLMVIGCRLAGLRGVTYLDVYRNGFERGYWGIEKTLMRGTCRKVFCRSEPLATSLRAAGVDAMAAGNVMMDTIPTADYDAAGRRTRRHAALLLPGSRDTTIDNFRLQMEALRLLPDALAPDVFCALSPGVDPAALAAAAGLVFSAPVGPAGADAGTLADEKIVVHLSRGSLGNLLAVADVALAQAGTATIQTIGSGVPAITFRAARNREARSRSTNALYDAARVLVDPAPAAAALPLAAWLGDDAERARRGAIGRERIGPPGAIAAIIAELER